MAVKNFDFRKNWVGSEVASMKIAFLPFLAPTGPNMGFFKQNFHFEFV